MARELVNPPELHPAPGFSHVAIADGTRVVHFAGQLGLERTSRSPPTDLHGQTVKAMRNVEVAMRAAGVAWDDVVRRTIYTTEPTAYEVIAQAIDEVRAAPRTPRRRSSGSQARRAGLPDRDECTAVTG